MAISGATSNSANITIINDGFFPDITLKVFIDTYRIPHEYDDEITREALKNSIIDINKKLNGFKNKIITINSFNSLALYTDVNINEIDAIPVLKSLYLKAVFCHAKAFLLQQFNTMNQKREAENAAKTSEKTYDFWMNQSINAVGKMYAEIELSDEFNDGISFDVI